MYNVCVEKLYIKILHIRKGGSPMYISNILCLELNFSSWPLLEQDDSYGYEISQTIKLIANIKESTLYPILKKIGKQ